MYHTIYKPIGCENRGVFIVADKRFQRMASAMRQNQTRAQRNIFNSKTVLDSRTIPE